MFFFYIWQLTDCVFSLKLLGMTVKNDKFLKGMPYVSGQTASTVHFPCDSRRGF